LLSCNRRYLEYLSSLDDFSAGIRALDRLTQPQSEIGFLGRPNPLLRTPRGTPC